MDVTEVTCVQDIQAVIVPQQRGNFEVERQQTVNLRQPTGRGQMGNRVLTASSSSSVGSQLGPAGGGGYQQLVTLSRRYSVVEGL